MSALQCRGCYALGTACGQCARCAVDPLNPKNVAPPVSETAAWTPEHEQILQAAIADPVHYYDRTVAWAREILRLRAENERMQQDQIRLDALEKFALQNCDEEWTLEFAEVAAVVDEESDDLPEDEAHIDHEFTVHGPRTPWGNRLGHGADLREAIDDALIWERAANRNDMSQSVPR